MKPARDIEVGDVITFTRNGKPEATSTIAKVLSRRGGLRRVETSGGDVVALRIFEDGSLTHETSDTWSVIDYRRHEPGDDEKILERNERARLAGRCHAANVHAWPIEDLRRVLAAWPGEKK